MKKILALTAVGLVLGTTAYAASVHLKPPHRNPTFFDHGLTLSVAGNLAGLGEGDVTITLTASANATATCTNPAGATQPPGQNPAPVTVSGGKSFPELEIDNGNLPFTVETASPVTPIAGAPGCPNPNWTEDITDLSFTDATIDVEQDGNLVLTDFCEFDPPTANDSVPTASVTCTTDGAPV